MQVYMHDEPLLKHKTSFENIKKNRTNHKHFNAVYLYLYLYIYLSVYLYIYEEFRCKSL